MSLLLNKNSFLNMKLRIFLIVFIFSSSSLFAQQGQGKKQAPVLHEVSNKDVVQSVFPEAVKVDKFNDYWFKILDEKGKTLGFALSSLPYCKDVIGYNNTTPVMIITDKKFVIQKTAILTNWETLGYVRKLEKMGFFDLWKGKKLKEAGEVQLDAYTGATKTAIAVGKNIDFLLANASKKLPKH